MPGIKRYTFLKHTADVLYEAYGKSYQEAFQNAALALFDSIADVKRLKGARTFTLKTKAPDLATLTSYALGDLLAASDGEDLFFRQFTVTKFAKGKEGYVLEGTASGEPRTREKGKMDVKAVTFHQTNAVEEKDGKWTIRVLLDI